MCMQVMCTDFIAKSKYKILVYGAYMHYKILKYYSPSEKNLFTVTVGSWAEKINKAEI